MIGERPIPLRSDEEPHFKKGNEKGAGFDIHNYFSLVIAGVIWLVFSFTILYIFIAAPQFLLPLSFLLLAIIAILNINGMLLTAQAGKNA